MKRGDPFTLTTDTIVGDQRRVSVSFQRLPNVVKSGDVLFLNDGIVRFRIARTHDSTMLSRLAAATVTVA